MKKILKNLLNPIAIIDHFSTLPDSIQYFFSVVIIQMYCMARSYSHQYMTQSSTPDISITDLLNGDLQLPLVIALGKAVLLMSCFFAIFRFFKSEFKISLLVSIFTWAWFLPNALINLFAFIFSYASHTLDLPSMVYVVFMYMTLFLILAPLIWFVSAIKEKFNISGADAFARCFLAVTLYNFLKWAINLTPLMEFLQTLKN